MSYNYRNASDIDFSQAPTYRKIGKLNKKDIEISSKEQKVDTVIKGKEESETGNTAYIGDFIITGPNEERYVLPPEKFAELYVEDRLDPTYFISKNRIRALSLSSNTEIIAPWGEKQRASEGSFVAQRVGNPDDVYLIDRDSFARTYELVSDVA